MAGRLMVVQHSNYVQSAISPDNEQHTIMTAAYDTQVRLLQQLLALCCASRPYD